MDVPFLFLTIVILTIGVLMVLSASFARAYFANGKPTGLFLRQAGFAAFGILVMYVTSRIRMSLVQKYSMLLLLASVLLLMAVPFIGTRVNGAKRWIDLKVTTFQPSEIAKLAVILSFATMICVFGEEKMKTFKYGVLPFGIILVLMVGLLYLEPHLSAAIIIIAVGGIMMFAGGTRLRWFAIMAVVVGLVGAVVIGGMGYAMDRINSWRDPFSDLQGDGWQIVQSLYAVGSGGFLGLGIGQGRQKYLYLPEEHNDFIFAVLCEELGFVGAVLVLILFALLIIRGYWIALHARNKYSSLAVTGITSLLAIQVFLNVAVVTNLVPCTGISLPFFSYGGTALLIQMLEMGIVLSVSREIPLKRARNRLKDAEEEYGGLTERKEA
ncbi:MAG: putative lipid II flippase FtsW [Oscillospiraceae bacterium]|nr:putative lipid II flippase FtsW [Oscillospiraceae bacterium]